MQGVEQLACSAPVGICLFDSSPVPIGITGESLQESPYVTIIFSTKLHFLLCQLSNPSQNASSFLLPFFSPHANVTSKLSS